MQYIIKNTIRITFLNSYKSVFYRSVVEENTYNKNTFIKSNVKLTLNISSFIYLSFSTFYFIKKIKK